MILACILSFPNYLAESCKHILLITTVNKNLVATIAAKRLVVVRKSHNNLIEKVYNQMEKLGDVDIEERNLERS